MSDKEMEKEIVSNGLTYPRITNDEIEEKMKQVKYDCHIVSGTTTTVITAYIPMQHINFSLCTEIMACVDPRNFNKELGEKYGIEKAAKSAKDKLWELEGYRLASQIVNAAPSSTPKERLMEEISELSTKIESLDAFSETAKYSGLDKESQKLLDAQSEHMDNYLGILMLREDNWRD